MGLRRTPTGEYITSRKWCYAVSLSFQCLTFITNWTGDAGYIVSVDAAATGKAINCNFWKLSNPKIRYSVPWCRYLNKHLLSWRKLPTYLVPACFLLKSADWRDLWRNSKDAGGWWIYPWWSQMATWQGQSLGCPWVDLKGQIKLVTTFRITTRTSCNASRNARELKHTPKFLWHHLMCLYK